MTAETRPCCDWCLGSHLVPVHGKILCPACAVAVLDALRTQRAHALARAIVAAEKDADAELAPRGLWDEPP